MTRPVLIDERDGACEICAKWRDKPAPSEHDKPASTLRRCNECDNDIPQYLNMAGSGFQSPGPHHYHLRGVLGINGRESIFSELCVECYLDAFKDKYPKSPLPDSVLIYSKKHQKVQDDITDIPSTD